MIPTHRSPGTGVSPSSFTSLEIRQWATDLGVDGDQRLGIDLGERPTSVPHSTASGASLVSNGHLGADVIRLSAGQGFVPHTHAGDHLLIVIGGTGTITYGGKIYPTHAGDIYLVAGAVPHAVGAITDHVILAVGSPHSPIDAADRMTPVRYDAVTSVDESLHCLICDQQALMPKRLHDAGCPHCPCAVCLGA